MTHQKVRPDFPTAGETDSGRARAAANQTVKACGETHKTLCAPDSKAALICGACVSPKPNARAQVYCSTRSRMRGRINPPPIHRSSEPSSSPRRGLKKENGRALLALPKINTPSPARIGSIQCALQITVTLPAFKPRAAIRQCAARCASVPKSGDHANRSIAPTDA